MRTQLHKRRPKQGEWVGSPTFRPWLRVAIALLLLVGIMVLAVVFTETARAAPGKTCKSGSHTTRITAAGVTAGRFTMSYTGCYWNDHRGVASLEVSITGYANAPYEYRGVIGEADQGTTCARTCTHQNNHMVVRERRVKYEFCLPFAGCVTTAQPWTRLTLDSYGNASWRTGS
jgi:hypothetical protein